MFKIKTMQITIALLLLQLDTHHYITKLYKMRYPCTVT